MTGHPSTGPHARDQETPLGPALEELGPAECLRLMATVPVGRICYTRQAMPAVEPVNFLLDNGTIVIRTSSADKLAAATRRAVVAFEADELDLVTHSGWSVTVIGTSEEVTDPGEMAQLGSLGLETWAPVGRDHFLKITPGIVTGRRLRPARA